ncbi:MAG TPA: TPM domain-containing protein [Bryobacteraceae bacterium]|nr:TPM domain-containing protein [Bryobacteraceae bacterium]
MTSGVRLRRLCRQLLFIFSLCLWSRPLLAVDVNSLPPPTGYVDDFAHVLNPADQAQLTVFCGSVERQLGVQFALVTVDTIGNTPVEDFAVQLARKWGAGDRKTSQGVLLLLVIRDHKSDIETGRGIEPYINDGFAGATLRSMRPSLRAGDYGAAFLQGARAMAQQIAEGKGIPFSADAAPVPARSVRHTRETGIPIPLIVFGIFVLLVLLGGRRGGGNFLWGMLLGSMLGGGRDRRDDGWGNGGGFGGDSGGGGGFGGFGGGDFGGGGANSDW